MSCEIEASPSCRQAGDTLANPDFDLRTAGPDQDRPGSPLAGWTTSEVAKRYRVGEDKVRAWITRGELEAVNRAARLCCKPRWVITPEALRKFENARRGGPQPEPPRRSRRPGAIDYIAELRSQTRTRPATARSRSSEIVSR